MKRNSVFFGCALALLAGSCGSGLKTPGTQALCNSSLSFDQDIKTIVAASGSGSCGSCHSGKYDNKSGIQSDRAKVYQTVHQGKMPQSNSGWKDTTDGKKFLSWAACEPLN